MHATSDSPLRLPFHISRRVCVEIVCSPSLVCQCFTSIVGPNGSGKSNVIDSMLFVFGYRAAKIRSKKVSVLIHKSDKFRDLKQCSVSVHFQQIIDNVRNARVPCSPDRFNHVRLSSIT